MGSSTFCFPPHPFLSLAAAPCSTPFYSLSAVCVAPATLSTLVCQLCVSYFWPHFLAIALLAPFTWFNTDATQLSASKPAPLNHSPHHLVVVPKSYVRSYLLAKPYLYQRRPPVATCSATVSLLWSFRLVTASMQPRSELTPEIWLEQLSARSE